MLIDYRYCYTNDYKYQRCLHMIVAWEKLERPAERAVAACWRQCLKVEATTPSPVCVVLAWATISTSYA